MCIGDKMKKINLKEIEYEIVKDESKVISIEEIESLMTEYFDPYDYILGDYSYGKLRLKGFYEDKNKKANSTNTYSGIENYINDFCAYKCKYFIIKKIKK